MTIYHKSEIRRGIFMEKDCGDAVFNMKSPPPRNGEGAPSLSEINKRLEAVRKKIAVLAQVVGQRK